jgi:hypothetical protein
MTKLFWGTNVVNILKVCKKKPLKEGRSGHQLLINDGWYYPTPNLFLVKFWTSIKYIIIFSHILDAQTI